MRRRGLEPPRAIQPTRPSTLRVYQFRHRRRWVRDGCRGGTRSIARSWFRPDPPLPSRTHVRTRLRRPPGSPLMDLTKRQQEIFDFIKRYSATYGYPPTVRDIGKAVGLASSSTVHAHLANLERLGMLRRDPTKPRAIELLDRVKGDVGG